MRPLALASLLASTVACGPTAREACVEIGWSVRIDEPEVGPVCAMEIAPDETIVLLAGGVVPALVEIEPDGSDWHRVELPLPAGLQRPGLCGHLAITPSGERWATLGFLDDHREYQTVLARVPVDGEPTTTSLRHPEATWWSPPRLAPDGNVLRVAGAATRELAGGGTEWRAAFGIIDTDTSELQIQHEQPDLAVVYALVPRAAQRVIALVAEPTLDYSDGRLLALDLERGELAWEQTIENVTSSPLGASVSVHEVEQSDVVVARRLHQASTITRYDAVGEPAWTHEREWDQGAAGQHVAVGQQIVALVSLFESRDSPQMTHVEALELDGESACTARLSLPHGGERRVAATRSGDAVLVMNDGGSEGVEAGLWVSSLSLRAVDRDSRR